MALRAVPIWLCCSNQQHSSRYPRSSFQLCASEFGSRSPLSGLSNSGLVRKWGCYSAILVQTAEQKPLMHSGVNSGEDEPHITKSKPLTAVDLYSYPNDASKVRVAYQGIPGAYGEAAALKAYPMCETVPCDQYEAAFKAVELWLVEKAVLPIENSVGGSIHRNYDLLLRHRLHIVGEVQLAVNHCLLGLPGVRKEELKRVLSHPQALDQCETTLNKLSVVRVSVNDSAGAAQMVASGGMRDTGAIASTRAAKIYGLQILAEYIQDYSSNFTRYLILAREPILSGTERQYKTSIVFALEEGPGVLFKALACFSLRDINLSKIESRPQRKNPLRVVDSSNKGSAKYFDYLFYIDFEASMAEPRAQNALGHLQEIARFIRVLGCYPMDAPP
ncbi:unnamed protein product [Cuscuta epithymum]|uniref:Arogenate dehydratase n=1 Tax=Cuscuta epithymum TaxID=186058 RepID=A0AAV0EF53_9ASTE|nr:unnamed protein product [Cuscuta epithymum]